MSLPKPGTPEYSRAMYRKHGDKRREYQREKAALKRQRNKQYVVNFLAARSCELCGFSNSRALCFDHLDPSTKFKCVGTMVVQGYSLRKIKEEIGRCRVLCHNCHSVYTKEQNGGSFHDWMSPISDEEFQELYGDMS